MDVGRGRAARVIAVLAALATSGHAALAQPTGGILDFGQTSGRRLENAPGADGGNGLAPAHPLSGVRYLDHSDVVEARLCRSFGISVRVDSGVPGRAVDEVEVHVRHPKFTRPDGATTLEDDFPSAVIDGVSHVGYRFDNPWEMQPGDWSIAVSVQGVEVARKPFTVVPPSPGFMPSNCEDAVES